MTKKMLIGTQFWTLTMSSACVHIACKTLDSRQVIDAPHQHGAKRLSRRVNTCTRRCTFLYWSLHARAVVLTKDRKSNPTQDNPNKISMGGLKAKHLLSNHLGSHSNTNFENWKKICDATTYKEMMPTLDKKVHAYWRHVINDLI